MLIVEIVGGTQVFIVFPEIVVGIDEFIEIGDELGTFTYYTVGIYGVSYYIYASSYYCFALSELYMYINIAISTTTKITLIPNITMFIQIKNILKYY